MEKIREVYSLLMPLQGARVVLPRAAVAEVTGYSRPKNRPDDAPDFLLGFIDWQGQQIPLISFELACKREAPEQGRRARIAIVFGIGGLLEPNAFAVLTQGYPYLVRVNEGVLKQEDLSEQDMQGPILARVKMANERPLIPDIETLEKMLANALGDRARAPEPAISEPAAADELDQLDVGGEEDFESGLLDEGSTAKAAANMAEELESLVEESERDLAEIGEVTGDYEPDDDSGTEDSSRDAGETDYSSELAELEGALEKSGGHDDEGSDDSNSDASADTDFSVETGELGEIDFSQGSGETDYSGELDDISDALEDTQLGENAPEDESKSESDKKKSEADEEAEDEKEEFSLDDIEFDLDDDEDSPDKED